MSQPVKLSDALVLDARLAGEAQERSIAGQVEFWARLGRCVEEHLDGRELRTLRETAKRHSLSELVEAIGKPEGRARLRAYLDREPFPHFEPHPSRKGWLVRIDEDGSRTTGRFVNRQFVADMGDASRPKSAAVIVLSEAPGSSKRRSKSRTAKTARA